MPQLPSGIHIGADPAPLRALLAGAPGSVHHILHIERADDLLAWLELVELKPTDQLTAAERAVALDAPGAAPPGMHALPMGKRLAEWRDAMAAPEDRAAMASFVSETIMPAMERTFAGAVCERQAAVRALMVELELEEDDLDGFGAELLARLRP